MDDLVTMFMNSLRERRRKGRLTQTEYEGIMKNLRNQLVAFVFTCINNDSTPRIEVTVRYCFIFIDTASYLEFTICFKEKMHREMSVDIMKSETCTCLSFIIPLLFIFILSLFQRCR